MSRRLLTLLIIHLIRYTYPFLVMGAAPVVGAAREQMFAVVNIRREYFCSLLLISALPLPLLLGV